jgi:hypothetical protein
MASLCVTRTTASEQLVNRLLDTFRKQVLVSLPHGFRLVAQHPVDVALIYPLRRQD